MTFKSNCKAAQDAIDEVFGDTSVDKGDTAKRLKSFYPTSKASSRALKRTK